MTKVVDAGEIYYVETFDIRPFETCESLYAKAEIFCLPLIEKFVNHIYHHGTFPSPSNIKWSRKATTRREFQEWLVLDPKNPEEFDRKIMASRHSKFPGPFVMVNGRRFGLVE
jgi:methionyl-tRNA formyltransferase